MTLPNIISFIGLTVHWAATDGHIESTILDFVKCVDRFLEIIVHLTNAPLEHARDTRAAILLLVFQNACTIMVYMAK
jgi:hypothetical protein